MAGIEFFRVWWHVSAPAVKHVASVLWKGEGTKHKAPHARTAAPGPDPSSQVRRLGFCGKGEGNHHTLFFGMVEETVHVHGGSTYFTSAFGHGAVRCEKDKTNGDRGTKKTQPILSRSSSHRLSRPALNPSSSPWRTAAKYSALTTALLVMSLRMRKATRRASTPSLFIPPTRVSR